jgi:UDP-glucose 4-epimerase
VKTVLVTGGAGYIGSHACKLLAKAGHRPIAFDNLSMGWRDAVRFGPLVTGDLLDRPALDAAFAEFRPDAVMHFAAVSDVAESVRDPGKYWRNNVAGSLSLLEAMRDAGCRQLVFSSTCAIYGDQDGVVLDEEAPEAPITPYAASKRAVEEMIRAFGRGFGLEAVVFRYFNVAGADPDGEIGEEHRPETHLVPRLIQHALGRGEAVTVHGTGYPTTDGTCVRDYVHVHDLVRAHLLGLEWLAAGRGSRLFNLGTGRGYSVREVISAARNVTEVDLTVVEGPPRPGDAAVLVSGGARAARELGWRPERSRLDEILRDAWRWHLGPGYSA